MTNSNHNVCRMPACFTCVVFISAVIGMTGCVSVEPSQKKAFSRPSMQMDSDPLADSLAEHVYFSREAASGGASIGGGGCGCN